MYMKRYIRSNDNSAVWTAKYSDINGNEHKVVAKLPTTSYEDAEDMFDEILPPYTSLRILGRVLSIATAKNDGFEVLEY